MNANGQMYMQLERKTAEEDAARLRLAEKEEQAKTLLAVSRLCAKLETS
jgi:hypothetical protein